MNFALSDEQRMFQEMFASFAAREVAPEAERSDRREALPLTLLEKAASQGFLAALVPEDQGGAGLDTISYCLFLEELAKADFATALAIDAHNTLALQPLLRNGSPEQWARFLEPMAFGERIGAFALTEPEAGSDVAALRTRAERRNGNYVLHGTKHWVANGAIAGLFLVFARTEHGVSAFLVPRETAGLQVGYREKTLGLRGLACNALYLDECQISTDHRLGEEGQGLPIAWQALDFDRLALSAVALGGAERALAEGVRFSIEHQQFGGPIALKQAIQNYVADTATEIEALRHLIYHAAWLADEEQPFGQDARMAKLFGSQVAMRAADSMLQVHGGYGYMKEFPIERLYRDCRALEILCGTSEIQRYLIAREIYRAQGLALHP